MPPIYVPLVELVPAPTTRDDILERARDILADIGQVHLFTVNKFIQHARVQTPIRLRKELPGFAVGSMQYAIFTRAWQLVEKCDRQATSVSDYRSLMAYYRQRTLTRWYLMASACATLSLAQSPICT